MTREEAIEIIENNSYVFNPLDFDRTTMINTALDMAIEALKQESILNKIRVKIDEHVKINQNLNPDRANALCWCLDVIDKYNPEREVEK